MKEPELPRFEPNFSEYDESVRKSKESIRKAYQRLEEEKRAAENSDRTRRIVNDMIKAADNIRNIQADIFDSHTEGELWNMGYTREMTDKAKHPEDFLGNSRIAGTKRRSLEETSRGLPEFEIIPGKSIVYVNRDIALVSLHQDFTEYISRVNPKAQPFELPIMELYSLGNNHYVYALKEDWKKTLKDFAHQFRKEYPEAEQVYSISLYSCETVQRKSSGGYAAIGPASDALGRELSDILFKRLLTFPCSTKTGIWVYDGTVSRDSDIKMIVDRSAESFSW